MSDAWFDAWDAAYQRPGQSPLDIAGLALLDEPARLGPVRYRRRHARTNPHTAMFGTGEDVPGAGELLAGVDVCVLDYLCEASPLVAAARGWSVDHAVRIVPHAMAPVADCRGSYAEWVARRSKKIRQRWPKLEAHALGVLGLRYERIERFADLPMLLAEIYAVERSGWKGRDGTAIADSAADTHFYTALATRAAALGVLQIAVLRQGDRIVAFEYSVLSGRRCFILKVGYDEAFEEASIGHVVVALHIRDCCADPRIDWYDQLGNGLTPAWHKTRFADALHARYRVTLYAPTLRGQFVRLHDVARAWAKRARDDWRAKRKPAV